MYFPPIPDGLTTSQKDLIRLARYFGLDLRAERGGVLTSAHANSQNMIEVHTSMGVAVATGQWSYVLTYIVNRITSGDVQRPVAQDIAPDHGDPFTLD